MIVRPFTFITGMMFIASGACMFVVKHQSQMLDQQLSQTNQATQQDEQSIRVLQAQWALEADPSRLAALAAQFTGLQPMKPGQLVTLNSLGSALPAAGSAAPGANPDDPVPAMPQLAAAAPAPVVAPAMKLAAAAVPAAPANAPVAGASVAVPAPAQLAAVVPVVPAAAAAKPRHHASADRLASVERELHDMPDHRAAHAQHGGSALYLADAQAPAPVARSVPMGAQLMPVRAVAAPAPVAMSDGGSMLGMAQGGPN